MSLAIKYENVEDARLRLTNTVVLYDKKPYYIQSITPGEDGEILRISAAALPFKKDELRGADGLIKNKFISSKYFDIAPFKMGYINLKGGLVYASRLPARQQSQGLSSKSISLLDNEGKQSRVDWATFLRSPETVAMIEGIYPTFEACLRHIKNGVVNEIAFCREFALVKDKEFDQLVFVYHKCERVGFIVGDKAELSKRAVCLKELLLAHNVTTL